MGLYSFNRSIEGVVKIDGSWNTKASFTHSLGSLIFILKPSMTLLPKYEVTGYQLGDTNEKSVRLLLAHGWR